MADCTRRAGRSRARKTSFDSSGSCNTIVTEQTGRPMGDRMWMLRAGRSGAGDFEFRQNEIVAIGFENLDLTSALDRRSIASRIREQRPEMNPGEISASANNQSRFRLEIQLDDWVVTFDTKARRYSLGRIRGNYEYRANLISERSQIRAVDWLPDRIDRNVLSAGAQIALNKRPTVFEIKAEARIELLKLFRQEVTAPTPPVPAPS